MVEMAGYSELLNWINLLFWAVAAGGIYLAWTKPKRRRNKVIASVLVAGLFLGPTLMRVHAVVNYQIRYAEAKALFDERCKRAGERVYRAETDVEIIRLSGTRGTYRLENAADAYWRYAGFPGESSGSQYIAEFLYYHIPRQGLRARSLGSEPGGVRGYRSIVLEEDGERIRYSLKNSAAYANDPDPLKAFAAKETGFQGPIPRFEVRYEDISEPQDREMWIAGGRVTVVDQQNGQPMGEFVRYAFEPGFGNTRGGRQPWAFALQCPQTSYGLRNGHIRSFVERVLVPKQGG